MAERTAEEWGRLAVSLPGWRWMPGMRVMHIEDGEADSVRGTYLYSGMQDGDLCIQWDDHAPRGLECSWANPQNFRPHPWVFDYAVPDPDDPATAGCLLALLGPNLTAYDFGSYADEPGENGMRFRVVLYGDNKGKPMSWPPVDCATLGRACIAAAEALGRWPGGEGA